MQIYLFVHVFKRRLSSFRIINKINKIIETLKMYKIETATQEIEIPIFNLLQNFSSIKTQNEIKK